MNLQVEIDTLKEKVKAAQEELDMAITFHEAWKPMAYDGNLHARMGNSYAAQTFFTVRHALRREMLLALLRLWDKDANAIRLENIGHLLKKDEIIRALAGPRAENTKLKSSFIGEHMLRALTEKRDELLPLIAKYGKDGSHNAVLEKLRNLRNTRLAHRRTTAPIAKGRDKTTVEGPDATDVEVDEFFNDNADIVSRLLSLVLALAYDPVDTAGVFGYYANLFWAAARGEGTQGHPQYRGGTMARTRD
jgi:hypothetical protein